MYTGPAAGLELGSGEPGIGGGDNLAGKPSRYNIRDVTEDESRDISDTDSDDIPTIPTGK